MGVQKKTRKFAKVKRMIGQRDSRLKKNQNKGEEEGKRKEKNEIVREMYVLMSIALWKAPAEDYQTSSLFLTLLSIQYRSRPSIQRPCGHETFAKETSFLSHSVQKKLELLPTMLTRFQCVMAELEKLGPKYRIALRIARDERWERLSCDHAGVYADDCLVDRVMKHKIYIVATNDRDLKRRVRKIPGVPIMSVAKGKYVIERLPNAPEQVRVK
ncbi:rRNA-processing protein fcf1 [Lecanora helva]